MSNIFDLLSWFLPNESSSTETIEPDDETVVELVNRARGETVTPEKLTNQARRTERPVVKYLLEDEQPEYVFRGGELLLNDKNDSLRRQYPSRESVVVVSDHRVLIVLGGRLSDSLWEIPLDSILDVYINSNGVKRYFVVEGNHDSNPITFFADVSIESNTVELESGAEYVARYID